LNVASGPGRDLQELLCANPLLAAKIRVHCIDQDAKALAYAGNLLKDFSDRITFEQANVLKWRSEDKYDLVWSAGLFDYLSAGLFTRVLRKFLLNCKNDGQVVIGNFSHQNVHRTYMEFGGWHLRHRSEAELFELAKRAGIEESRIRIGEEENGVNLFLHISC
jgi:extracellular factor (EF) 3-hydroxypalmitic acid methyl ester biosynthesis protein